MEPEMQSKRTELKKYLAPFTGRWEPLLLLGSLLMWRLFPVLDQVYRGLKHWILSTFAITLLFGHATAKAQCVSDETHQCVSNESIAKIKLVLQERACLDANKPEFTVNDIPILVDRYGRVFVDSDKKSVGLRMKWCHYDVTATRDVNVLAARQVPPDFGFRLRLKLTGLAAPTEMFRKDQQFIDGVDLAAAIEPIYYRDFNLNAVVGLHLVGLAVGFDVTNTATLLAGVTTPWSSFRVVPTVGLSLSLW